MSEKQKGTTSTARVAKSSTVSTEVVMGAAANKLNKAVGEIKGAFDQLTSFTENLEDLTLKIANAEDRIKSLDEEYKEKKRQASVDLELNIKADQQRTVATILDSMGKHAIDKEESDRLVKELADLKANFDSKLASENKKLTAIMESQFKAKEELLNANFAAKEASNHAEIANLKSQLAASREQANEWKEALTAERQAGVERARAGAIQNLNIPTGSGK